MFDAVAQFVDEHVSATVDPDEVAVGDAHHIHSLFTQTLDDLLDVCVVVIHALSLQVVRVRTIMRQS